MVTRENSSLSLNAFFSVVGEGERAESFMTQLGFLNSDSEVLCRVSYSIPFLGVAKQMLFVVVMSL